MAYSFFLRGKTIYWNEDLEVLERAHVRACTEEYARGFPYPGPIGSTDLHPSRMVGSEFEQPQGAAGHHWRVEF
jgi:hypothetical protein